MQNVDTVYDAKPWASNEERLISEALISQTDIPGDILQANVRPPLPRTQLFPNRFGYRTEPLGIRDILDVNTVFPGARVDYSGSASGYSGTSRPSLGIW